MKLRVVTPIVTKTFGIEAIRDLLEAAGPGDQVVNVFLDRGPASIESEFDEALAAPDTVAKVVAAEDEGADAVLINCMGDPGLKAAREAVRIPVLGVLETSAHVACMLGRKFSIITVLRSAATMIHNRCLSYGLEGRLASVRWVNIPVLELERDRGGMVSALVQEAGEAIAKDGAEVIVFGCTGMAGVAGQVREDLWKTGLDVPVVDPAIVTLKIAGALAGMNLSQSKLTYAYPREKELLGYDIRCHPRAD